MVNDGFKEVLGRDHSLFERRFDDWLIKVIFTLKLKLD